MIFAVDFDGTFAADPETFSQVIMLLRRRGHTAIIVTGRSDEGEFGREVRETIASVFPPDKQAINQPPPIVFAGLLWKREAAEQAGYSVDVWMDDLPEYIAQQNIP